MPYKDRNDPRLKAYVQRYRQTHLKQFAEYTMKWKKKHPRKYKATIKKYTKSEKYKATQKRFKLKMQRLKKRNARDIIKKKSRGTNR